MERTLFSDLVVSRGAGRVRAGGMPLSMAVHAGALAAVVALSLAVPAELPRVTGPIVDPWPVPAPRPAPPADVRRASVQRRAAAPGRTRVVAVPIIVPDAPPAPDTAGVPEDPAVLCLGCAPADPVGDGDGSLRPAVGGDGGAAPTDGPVRVGGIIRPPLKVRHVDPRYPELARATGVGGVVVIECVIDREGAVRSVQLVSGHPLLNEAALAAVRQWAYRPTLLNGVPIEVVMTVTVRFTSTRPR